MSDILNRAGINAVLGAGSVVLNDYALNITPIERGYRLTVKRGSETQTMDILDGVGIVGIEKTGSTGDVDSYRVTFTDGSTFDYTIETNAAAHAAAEAARVEAENSRASAESARESAEVGRVNVEDARVAAEAARESAETARASAESARAQAEDGRQSAEAARVAAEQSRASAESVRVAAENARVAAETARANAENERSGAEALRAAEETDRANAESGRVSAEQGRVSAESERVAAEEARATEFAGFLEDIAQLKDELVKDRNSFNVDQIGFKIVENAYVNGDTGAFVAYSSSPKWSRTDYIAVDNTVSLIINTTRPGGDNAFYDANKNYISKIQLYVGENKIVVPTNAKYAAFSSRSADMENLTIQREYLDQAIREKNVVYNANAIFGITDFGTIYNVGDGKTYETINSAITAWANAGYPYATIFIDPGEYKEAVTIESGHQINLIGSGIDSTIIHTTSGNYVDAPITIFHGTVTVKNMTLLADHSENPNFDYEAPQTLKAYGIHIDHGSVGGVVSVEKCKIISYQAPAVGTGTIPDSKIRLVDCECYSFTDFTSDTTTHQYYQLHNGAILWHTSKAEDYPTRGNESFEMVNVKAYNKNDYCVLRLIKNQDEDAMSLLAINTTLVKGTETWQSPILGTVPIAEGSAFNNYDKLNYN